MKCKQIDKNISEEDDDEKIEKFLPNKFPILYSQTITDWREALKKTVIRMLPLTIENITTMEFFLA